jgi:hypothetical protein
MAGEAHVIHRGNCAFSVFVPFEVNKPNATTSQAMRVNQNSALSKLAMANH